jgi:hypothetical protein
MLRVECFSPLILLFKTQPFYGLKCTQRPYSQNFFKKDS